ncbi:MAG: ATP-binding cassette domain-containing protein [Candidatus Paceibacterota bacterium]|jgi:branched-chain amino acid transport system ATP-binding protein
MENKKTILAVEDLHVQIGQRMILHEISFSVTLGEIVGIIGPNGCGKTTLLNTLSGFLPVETGTISFNGEDIMHLEPYVRARLGVSRGFQHVGVFRDMTVEENLMIAIERAEKLPWWWKFSSTKREHVSRIIDAVLADVDLFSHKKSLAGILSGGQLRLLELTRLRLLKGNLLLIDEPTAGVSPILKNKLSDIIKKLVREHGHTAIIVEHDLKFLFDLADRIIVLVDGEKYMEGTPSEIRGDERLKKVYLGE